MPVSDDAPGPIRRMLGDSCEARATVLEAIHKLAYLEQYGTDASSDDEITREQFDGLRRNLLSVAWQLEELGEALRAQLPLDAAAGDLDLRLLLLEGQADRLREMLDGEDGEAA